MKNILLAALIILTSCGGPDKPETIDIVIDEAESKQNCDGQKVGTLDNSKKCDAGYLGFVTQECKLKDDYATWEVVDAQCRLPPSQCQVDAKKYATFVDIKPIIDEHCMSCHSDIRLNTYPSALAWGRRSLQRIQEGQNTRMPEFPKEALSPKKIGVWQSWVDGGLLERDECVNTEQRTQLEYNTNDKLIRSQISAVEILDGRSQSNARFVTADTRFNAGALPKEMQELAKSLNEMINYVSSESELQLCKPIGAAGVCMVDLDELGLTPLQWEQFVGAAELTFIDNTDLGRTLRDIVGSDYPTLTGGQFIEGAIADATNYYYALGIAKTLDAYFESRGVDLEQDTLDFRAKYAGMASSKVGNLENRLIIALDSDEGRCTITFDIEDANVPESNLAEFPFLFQSQNLFLPVASETICTMANGAQEFGLWNAAGIRQDVAPTTIVSDFRKQAILSDNEIRIADTCIGCHPGGLNIFQEDIRDSILSNPDFDAEEIRVAKELYATQSQMNGIFVSYNTKFHENRLKLDINTLEPNPTTFWFDDYRLPWGLDKLCGHIRLSLLDGCEAALKTTSVASTIRPMFQGRTISKTILNRVFDDIVIELGIGEEPINGFTQGLNDYRSFNNSLIRNY